MQEVSIGEVELIAFQLAKQLMAWNEPIPPFGDRYPNVLEACLKAPHQAFGGKDLYPGLLEKAAVLFYFLIKDHPFQNGNKRIAVMCLLYFLYKNGKWLKITNEELYRFAVWVASSPAKVKSGVVDSIKEFLRPAIINR